MRDFYCSVPECEKPAEGRTGLCASHNKASRTEVKVRLKKISDKLKPELDEYSRESREWLKGKRCAVFPHLKAVELHHKRGRGKYLNDPTYWLAVSREGHMKIENNPHWAKMMRFTVSRLTDEEPTI